MDRTIPVMVDPGSVVAAYWEAADARDWTRFGELLADDVVYEAPQSRERVRGRDAYLRFNAEGFPGEWRIAVERIVAAELGAVSLHPPDRAERRAARDLLLRAGR